MSDFLQELSHLETKDKDVVTLYNEISELAMRECVKRIAAKEQRNAYYLSMEFLIGRSFYNNLMELGVLEETKRILAEKGVDINVFEEIEDAALGNGGLGRLAACFMDSAAALGLPLYGYGIRFRYGLFRQRIEDGFQKEYPDNWQRFGDPWSIRREEEAREIKFADYTALAVPYDVPIIGKRVNCLRLYQAEGCAEAEKISEYLYPADDTEEGKLLRLRQEYFFSAAAIGELVDRHAKLYGNHFESFPKYNTIQLNDTHPVLAIAELVRLLTANYRVSVPKAVEIAKQTFNYTNHTVLPEALECWREELVRKILPDIADILLKLVSLQKRELKRTALSPAQCADLVFYDKGVFSMAKLAIWCSSAINGVAALHTEILKKTLFATAYSVYPEKFQNKTNGVTKRRWLMLNNPELSALIDGAIGTTWREARADHSALKGKVTLLEDDFIAVKREKRRQLFAYIEEREGVKIPEHFLVYAQVKRLHEYKRQFMTALAILEIYDLIKSGAVTDFRPSLFLFGAKSAPSYVRAKGIIKFINEIAKLINGDEQVNKLLRVVFVQNYDVSYAEKIVAGTDVSLQVSTAGLEASGTGNMKFMMNGAVTCGTLDGANIEIVEHAGKENNYIFGATVDEIARISDSYDPNALLAEKPLHKKAVESLIDGTLSDGGTGCFAELYNALTQGASWHEPDNYFVLYDLESYVNTLLAINRESGEQKTFARKQLYNVASSSFFSSDRTIMDYAENIWHIS
ncbi:MAG: glycogen/starch/alpha-glucan family phosphorylase [Clostridia bacterium]|nr:glycogen/starch/alpha-glucan family phosphorylase [Clostridia bacterium]